MTSSRRAKSHTVVLWAIVATSVFLNVYLHIKAGFGMPSPWPDEAHFLWQATAFAEQGTLASPELNPDREILWQPPGYFILVGSLFEIFGSDLEVARGISLGFLIMSFLIFVAILREFRFSWPVYLLTGLFWTNSTFVATGNVARMEAPLLAFGLLGIYLILNRRRISGLALLALTPLIHPNGIFFGLAGGMIAVRHNQGSEDTSPMRDRLGWVLAGIVLAGWVYYILHAAEHWSDFSRDMQFQFQRKGQRSWLAEFYSQDSVRLIVYSLPGLLWVFVRSRRHAPFLILAASMWGIWISGGEMWYRIFYLLAVLIAQIILVQAAHDVASRWMLLSGRWRQYAWTAAVAGFLVLTNLRFHNIEKLWNLKTSMSFCDMTPQWSQPYNQPGDAAQVIERIQTLAADQARIIEIVPSADAFVFMELRSRGFQFSRPLFSERRPDILLYHESSTLPHKFRVLWDEDLLKRGLDTINRPEYLIHQNSSGETWYARKLTIE